MLTSLPPWMLQRIAYALILGVGVLRLVYLSFFCPFDLAPDEAHYWDWSRHLDICYYSKGPLVAWLIHASGALFGGLSVALRGDEMLAVRIPAVVCGSLLLWSLYALTVQVYRSEGLGLAVVATALTLPLISAGGLLMTIDAPFTCCWGWALVFAHRALFAREGWAWPAAGLCLLLGVLAKHTMVLWVPCLGLFLLFTPEFRRELLRTGFWTAATIGALGGLPILLWNWQNDWVTLKHTGGHAGMDAPSSFRWLGPVNYFALQFLVLLGFWFVAWVRTAWTHRPGREREPQRLYLWWMSVPLVLFFGLFSLKNGGGEPNWPIAGYLAGGVLTAGWLAQELKHAAGWYRRFAQASLAAATALGLALTALVHEPAWARPAFDLVQARFPTMTLRRLDPTCRLRGWRMLGAEIDRLVEPLRQAGEEPLIAGSAWIFPGELGFYCQGHPQVFTVGPAIGDRQSQYDLWRPNPVADPETFRGRTMVIVGTTDEVLREAFERVELAQVVVYEENGREVARWPISIGRGFRGFPTRTASSF